MSMHHVTTPKRFIYASVRMDSTEMGLGVLVSNKFMNCHTSFRPDSRESTLRDMIPCRIRNPGNFSFGIWNRHDSEMGRGGGGGVGRWILELIFAGYVPLASRSPYPIIVHSVANYRPYLSHFWSSVKFSRSQFSHFLFVYLPYIEWRTLYFSPAIQTFWYVC